METGLKHTTTIVVTENDTAIALGSGDMPVLATPRMMALMENAAMLAVQPELPEGSTTVGGQIESSHLRPTAVGQAVRAEATLTEIDGRKLYFHVAAYQGDTLIGKGKHLRFVVAREKFMSKMAAQ